VALSARINVSECKANHSLQFGADFKNNLKESSTSPCSFTAREGTPLLNKTTLQCKDNFVPHKLNTFFNYQLNAQFINSITIYMLLYNPRRVSSNTMLIFRRSNCIVTASGFCRSVCDSVTNGTAHSTHHNRKQLLTTLLHNNDAI
jgi:hypothetical protein